jgi:hypothetical protein
VKDGRTGATLEVPIFNGRAVSAAQFKKLKGKAQGEGSIACVCLFFFFFFFFFFVCQLFSVTAAF